MTRFTVHNANKEQLKCMVEDRDSTIRKLQKEIDRINNEKKQLMNGVCDYIVGHQYTTANIAIEVHDGMVQAVYTNFSGGVNVDVYDRDINITSHADQIALDQVEKDIDAIQRDKTWRAVW